MTFLNDWENPSVHGIHKIKPHVPLRSYETIEQIFEYYTTLPDGSTSGRCQSLDGLWKFTLCSSPETIPDGFHQEEYDDSLWSDVCRSFWLGGMVCCDADVCVPGSVDGRPQCVGDARAWYSSVLEL